MRRPTLQGVLEARQAIRPYLRPTPLLEHPLLSRELGCRTWVKHENHNPTAAFKIRGGLNLLSRLSDEERARGLVTATRGNHGQSIALAGKIHGVKATIVVPFGNNPEKNAVMRAFGADLIEHGRDFDEARELVDELRQSRGMRLVHPANEPLLIEGVGTYALEVLEDLPDVDVIFVPLGGGSGACGILTVVKAMAPKARVVAVQASKAPSIRRSWLEGRIVTTDSADTIADGLATRVPFELTFEILRESIDDILEVSEEEIADAIRLYWRTTHNAAEGAAAAALAGARRRAADLKGKRVALIFTGGNIDTELLHRVLGGAAS